MTDLHQTLPLPGLDAGGEGADALSEIAATLESSRPAAPMDPGRRRSLRSALLASHPGRGATADAGLRYSSFATAIGILWVAYGGDALRYTDLDVPEELFRRECAARFGAEPQRDEAPPARLVRAVTRYLEGKGPFEGPVDLAGLPEFHQRVLRKTMAIRRGEVRSYAWLAREVGAPKAARAVGTAMARNPIPILIPCHRVVRTDYRLGEYGCGGPPKKREILAHEGVDLQNLERLAARGARLTGSTSTRIFCLPSCYTGRRMKPERRVYFASEEEARAAGFRPCKVCRPA